MMKKAALLLSVLCALALVVLGCAGEKHKGKKSEEEVSADELVEEGKLYLSYAEPDIAREKFLEALDIEPDHPEALYGVPLSDALHILDVYDILIQYINMFMDPGFDDSKQEGSFDEVIDSVLDGMAVDPASEAIEYVNTCLERGATSFTMDELAIPIIIDHENLCDLTGEFTKEELLAIWAFSEITSGLMKHAIALNLNFDLSLAMSIEDIDFSDILTGLGELVDILLELLNDPGHPGFLTIEEGYIPLYSEAGRELGLGLLRLNDVFWAIMGEPANGNADDIFHYEDLNGNGVWDAGEPLAVPCEGALDETEMAWIYAILDVATDMGYSFIDYSEYDPDPDNPNPFDLATLNRILELLGYPPILPSIEIDFGANYVDPDPTAFRDTLVSILEFLDSILP